jgi:O-antigen/teichoic acid export membrane protein
MSRLKNFTHSLVSAYAQIAVNVLYTLASVPLALHYLSKAEFGLWALTLQVASFIALVDLGMGSSIARILIDHKDDRHNGRYGGAVKSGLLVGLAQGLIILVAGFCLLWFMAGWLRVSHDLARPFFWLMAGQVLLTAATFATRIFGQVLYAWQRIDVSNYSGMVQLAVGFAVLWIGFALGSGIYSLLAGAAASWICGFGINAWACLKFGFWPKAGEWGRASREQFRELFNYGASVFLISIGIQLIISSQTVLVARQLGLEAAGLWSVMTKMFTLVSQIVSRIVGNAMPVFAEMQVRGEFERLWHRYRALFITTNVFAGVCAVLFAACNGPFVTLLTQGKFLSPTIDNVLLGIWLVVSAQQCCHNSIVICLKEVRTLKYIFMLEGIVFIGVAFPVLRSNGISGMLVCSVVATTLFTWLSGAWHVAKLSKMGWKPLLWDWQKPLVLILIIMVPIWLAICWILHDAPTWIRLAVNGAVLTATGAWVAIRYALPFDFIEEIAGKLPKPLQSIAFILRKKSNHDDSDKIKE